jgi:hypothetical protein
MDNIDDNIQEVLSRLKQSGMLLSSDAVIRQEIPLKPEIFHGRDGLVEEIGQLLMQEETSRICILGPGGMGKTSVSLAVVELPFVGDRFPLGNRVWLPCIEATSATRLLELLYIQLQVPEINKSHSKGSFPNSMPRKSPVLSCLTISRLPGMGLMGHRSRLEISFVS